MTNWQAFVVPYSLPGSSGHRVTVLSTSEEDIPYWLEQKVPDFKKDSSWCKMGKPRAVPLSSVLVGELSITELKNFLGK